MTKNVKLYPNERVDIPDLEDKTSNFSQGIVNQLNNRTILAGNPGILEGFRVEIPDQGTYPGQFTIVNGRAFDRSGQFITNENDVTAARSHTLSVDGTYFVEIEYIESDSDVASRAFWDTTFNNGTDPSGDPRPGGREFNQSVASRITPDWDIVSPISTTAFAITGNANSTKIPVAVITVSSGVITGGSSVTLKTTFAAHALVGSSTIKLFDTRAMPQAFTLTIQSGASDTEDVVVTANDNENGILTLSSPTTYEHYEGAFAQVSTTGTPAVYLPEGTSVTMPSSGTADARIRYYGGNENTGYGLSLDPNSTDAVKARADISVQSLRNYVDFVAGQLREIKFGASRSTDIGNIASASSFNATPRYYDFAGGYQGARIAHVTLGDGVNTWGDFNTTQAGSASAALAAAITATPDGGVLFIKKGTYALGNSAASITLANSISIVGEAGGVTIQNNSSYAIFNITAGSNKVINFEGLNLTVNGTAAYAVTESSSACDFLVNNCIIQGIQLPAAAKTMVLHSTIQRAPNSSGVNSITQAAATGHTHFLHCDLSNDLTGASARVALFVSPVQTVFENCLITCPSSDYGMEFSTTASQGIKFDTCYITGGGASTIGVKLQSSSNLVVLNCKTNLTSNQFTDAGDFDNIPNSGNYGGLSISGSFAASSLKTGQADVKHGSRTVRVPVTFVSGDLGGDNSAPNASIEGNFTYLAAGDIYYVPGSNTSNVFVLPLPLADGDRLLGVDARVFDNQGGTYHVTMALWKRHLAAGSAPGAPAQIGTSQVSTNTATNIQKLALTGLTETITSDYIYYMLVDLGSGSGGSTSLRFYAANMTYDRP